MGIQATSTLDWLPSLLMLTAVYFFIGRALQRSIGRKSEWHRIHGQFVFWWAIPCYFVGWFVPWCQAPTEANFSLGNVLAAQGGCGLLIGWLIGTIHGAIVLAWRGSHHS